MSSDHSFLFCFIILVSFCVYIWLYKEGDTPSSHEHVVFTYHTAGMLYRERFVRCGAVNEDRLRPVGLSVICGAEAGAEFCFGHRVFAVKTNKCNRLPAVFGYLCQKSGVASAWSLVSAGQ